MPTDSSYLRVGEPSENGDLVTKRFQRFKGFVEGEVLALSLGEPMPLAVFAIFVGEAYAIRKIDGTML